MDRKIFFLALFYIISIHLKWVDFWDNRRQGRWPSVHFSSPLFSKLELSRVGLIVAQSLSDSLPLQGLQHIRLLCPPLSPGDCSNSCPLSWWCHLILSCPLLLGASIFSGIRIFANKSPFRIRWPKYWSFSFSISPSNEYS